MEHQTSYLPQPTKSTVSTTSIWRRVFFFRESLRNLRSTGSVLPSSRSLCRAIVKQIDAQLTQTVVELGPGDGVIIQYILEKLQALNIPPAWVIACKKQTSSLLAPQ
jgi:hypothetical protein